MPYIHLTDVTNRRQPRGVVIRTEHIEIGYTSKVEDIGGGCRLETVLYLVSGRELRVSEELTLILDTIVSLEAR